MSQTFVIEATTTIDESLARREIGDRYYAGIPSSGYLEQVEELQPSQQLPISPSPTGTYLSIIAAVDVNTNILLGWVDDDVVTELPVTLLSILTPPAGVQPYVRNAGLQVVPVRLCLVY